MSDNISPADEIKRRLVLFLRIPTEVWTDVLKTIPRKNLVKNIAPTCFRLKEISDKNVKNVHVIKEATQFTKKLEDGDPEANQHLEQLAANDCQLAGQFKLSEVQTILRHCPDLFDGCHITLHFEEKNKDSKLFLECLTQLEEAKPILINVSQRVDQVIDYWHHPTILNCSRIRLDFWSDLSAATLMNVFDWLHHQPNGVDRVGSADQEVRCMTVWGWGIGHNEIDWLINRCSENIQQSQQLIDRRPFVLSFYCFAWPGFGLFHRIENKSTGEVLTLERKMHANSQPTNSYRLRRCLADEEAKGAVFYADMFKQDYAADIFDIGDKTTKVMIE